MLRNTVRWRKEFGIEGLIEEYLGNDWDKVVFSHGHDKEGHPVYYNVFDEFEDKELYNKTGISTIVQLNDLKNSPGLGKRELSDSGQDYKRNAYMEPDLQFSNAIQSMEKRLRAACNASDAKIDNVAKVLHAILCQYEKSIQTPEKWQKLVVFLQQRFVSINCF
ncbi:hypothetical protein JHK87_000994 [Glycine soja]|nr:hypothetical protein JHK87_000994 [Glycine soja]